MPSLGRTAVLMTCYALSALVVVCASPSAAEPTTIALLRNGAQSVVSIRHLQPRGQPREHDCGAQQQAAQRQRMKV
jgi:hypothetical protein